MLALAARSWPIDRSYHYLGIALLFALNSFIDSRQPLQAMVFLVFAVLEGFVEAASLLCLVAVIVAALIVLRRGWFVQDAPRKAMIVKSAGCAALIFPLVLSKFTVSAVIPTIIYVGVFLALIRILARSRLLSALTPKKRILLLSEYHLTEHEKSIALRRAKAITVKEIASELHLTVPAVRNGLSSSYRKLEVKGYAELVELGSRYQLK
jgi:DNA-binding CsgD family transcriptional regulator